MYFINFSFTISHEESVHVDRMKSSVPQWTSKATSVLSRKQMGKCQIHLKKLCRKDILFSAGFMGNSVWIWNLGLVVQTLFINSNYWKQLLINTLRHFLRDRDEKWIVRHLDWWKKKGRFCTSLYILGIWGDVAGFIYEWKVKGVCIPTYY